MKTKCISAIAASMLAAAAASAPARNSAGPARAPVPRAGSPAMLHIDPAAVMEILPLAMEAMRIQQRSYEREARHRAALARRGIAEVPACGSQRYTFDAGGLSGFAFDEWGDFYIDRRFVTDEEMKTVHAIEEWIRKWFPSHGGDRKFRRPRKTAGRAGLPVFRGFEDARYQMHDELIARMTAEFNASKAAWCGGTPAQAARIPDLSPALVKAHMIEESGGNGPASRAAWTVDPLQVNVPGDWGPEKTLLGLRKPARRNEGTAAGNVRAAIMYLSRKGFGSSGKPAGARPSGYFDGWGEALRRYNGRRDRTDTDRYYSDEYAGKIVRRASNPDLFVPIEIKLAKKKPAAKPAGPAPAAKPAPAKQTPAKPAPAKPVAKPAKPAKKAAK